MMKPADLNGRILEVPIIQGGMGVGVSLSSLAGHVMKEGGMGVISAAHPGYARQDSRQDSIHANAEGGVRQGQSDQRRTRLARREHHGGFHGL